MATIGKHFWAGMSQRSRGSDTFQLLLKSGIIHHKIRRWVSLRGSRTTTNNIRHHLSQTTQWWSSTKPITIWSEWSSNRYLYILEMITKWASSDDGPQEASLDFFGYLSPIVPYSTVFRDGIYHKPSTQQATRNSWIIHFRPNFNATDHGRH